MSRVLVVDDSLTVRMDLVEAFESVGIDAEPCASLAEARRSLAASLPGLVVLDVQLPDGSGFDLLAELRQDSATRDLPVMILSSEGQVDSRIRGVQGGASEYVGKPYDTTWLIGRARELLSDVDDDADAPLVLAIDDSATQRAMLSYVLTQAGYRFASAETGEEGLRLAAALRPQLILVDGMLPGIQGAEVIRRLRMDPGLRQTPCIYLTGSYDGGAEIPAFDAGADSFLEKDGDNTVLLTRIGALLRRMDGAATRDAAPSSMGSKRILAIDDSLTYLQALADELRDEGYDVVTASSGAEGLALLSAQPVDCILLDMIMPEMSGEETCQRIKADASIRDIPLIFLTAREEREAMIAGIKAGADDYIPKSADFDVLKARLLAQLRRKQYEDENRQFREELLRREMEASEARAARELAETRARLLADLEAKNAALGDANEALLRAKDAAEQQSRYKSRFLANMSHELRTPMNAIIGFSELLEQELFGTLNDKQKEYVGHVVSSAHYLLNLINDILDLSKVEAGKIELRRELVPMETVIGVAETVAAPLASKRQVAFSVDCPDDLPALYLDPTRIKQVLYNLLSNAIKFTPNGGRVVMRVEVEPEVEVRIAVEDTGVGIREEDLDRLFKEFEQIEPIGGVKPKGTGLGLALSQRLVHMHNGHISVRSKVGEGSTFTVHLPLSAGLGAPGLADPERRERPVLVVDDDPASAELIVGYLQSGGLPTAVASTAREAMQRVGALQPQAVTLDVRLPDEDGWSVLARLRQEAATAELPVVIVSMLDEPNRGLLLGASDYLVKPVTRAGLLDALAMLGCAVARVDDTRVVVVGRSAPLLERAAARVRGVGCPATRLDDVAAALAWSPDCLLLGPEVHATGVPEGIAVVRLGTRLHDGDRHHLSPEDLEETHRVVRVIRAALDDATQEPA